VVYYTKLDTRAWEIESCRGHFDNINCCEFFPRQNIILSCGDDKTIRVFDADKKSLLHTIRRQNERIWIVVGHPEQNLYAAGHDSGLVVFKLEQERPAQVVYGDSIYYIKEKHVKKFDMTTVQDVALSNIRRGQICKSKPPRTISYNPAENSVIIYSVSFVNTAN
jgi:coatomer protein complex subunit alpha (xenin)